MNRIGISKRLQEWSAVLCRASAPTPSLSRWVWLSDGALALAVAVGTVYGALSPQGGADVLTATSPPATPAGLPVPPLPVVGPMLHYGPVEPWQVALAALSAWPLAARRRYPLAAFWVVIAANVVYHLTPGFDPAFTFVACVIAAYSAAVYSPYRVLAIGSALIGAGVIVGAHSTNVPDIAPGLLTILFLIPIGLTANMIHAWRERVHVLEEQKIATARRAAERERSRLARELHDVVSHNVSVMLVQAGAARMVMDTAPEKARDALLAIEAGGRAAMSELRHVMGLLSMNSDNPEQQQEAELMPSPGLEQIEVLVERIRETGVPVELRITGDPAPLPAGADLAAYRVVQEALTNTMKHAAGAAVDIVIEHTPLTLRVDVTDTGGIRAASVQPGGATGLAGLRERLAVFGGTLETGRANPTGFRVRAVIPREAR